MESESVVILAIIDAVLVGMFFLFDVQAPLFGAILATTTCLILVYVHGVRISDEALTATSS